METLTDRILPCSKNVPTRARRFSKPHFAVFDHADLFEIEVYIPGVLPKHVDLLVSSETLTILAYRDRKVRANWQSANLEGVQDDYRLAVRIDETVDGNSISAVHCGDILTIQMLKTPPSYPAENKAA